MSVYFAERDGLVKIGYSKSPELRCLTLHARLLRVVDGDRRTERAMHMRFGDSWVDGEWFRPTPDLCQFIENGDELAPAPPPAAMAAPLSDADRALVTAVAAQYPDVDRFVRLDVVPFAADIGGAVPVRSVAGKHVVSLRRLVEFINSESEVAS